MILSHSTASQYLTSCVGYTKRSFHWLVFRYRQLSVLGKIILFMLVIVTAAIWTFVIYIGPATIAQTLFDWSQQLRELKYGWLLLLLVMIITSFPPLVGYSTCISLCGFAWGARGFILAGPATVLGSAVAFTTMRYVFLKHLQVYSAENDKWRALSVVIKQKGLPLIILIRFSPFPPHVYSNALFASILSVALWQFLIATLCTLPKIFLTVFVASRIAALSDGKTRGDMDRTSQLLNLFSVVFAVAVGITASWIVYRQMRKELQEADSLIADEEAVREPLLDPYPSSG